MSGRPKGIKNKNGHHTYTTIEIEWLREMYQTYEVPELTKRFNRKFKCHVTKKAIGSTLKRNHITCDRTGQFQKGQSPINKGKTWDEYMSPQGQAKSRRTTYKKGNIPKNHREIGSLVMRSDGYIYEKIKEPNNCRPKHHLVWEEAHGPIKDDHVIVFLNGDHWNYDISNLAMVPRRVHATMCKMGFYSDDRELTILGLKTVELMQKVTERRVENEKQARRP
jgi:hypothetical protein